MYPNKNEGKNKYNKMDKRFEQTYRKKKEKEMSSRNGSFPVFSKAIGSKRD
jgi:hypothetical protein